LTTAVRLEGEAALTSLYGSPGYGAGESVEDEGPHAFHLLCFDAATGELLWDRVAAEGVPKVKRHPKSSHANPTPAVDGERVLAFFGSEGLYAFDHRGELLWKRDFGVLDCGAPRVAEPAKYQWGFASSPVLHEGRVIVQADTQDQSFLTVLEAADGDQLWRVARDEDPTWSTPTVCATSAADAPQIVVNGYKHVGGYDLESGAEIWKLSGGGDVPVPTPVVSDGLIFITSAHGPERPIHAIFTDAEGTLTADPAASPGLCWTNRHGIYMQTPLVHGGLLYACSDGGVLSCFEALSGAEVYRERLGDGSSGFSGSAVASGAQIYFTGENGVVLVVKAGREFELLASNDMGETCMATPAIADGTLFVRTRHHLVAVAE
jgi:outer membrane protein assembly factor BamB